MSTPIPEQTLRPTNRFLLSLCAEYSREFPDPNRPVRSELVAHFITRIARLVVLTICAPELIKTFDSPLETDIPAPGDIRAAAKGLFQEDFGRLCKQINELDSWLHEPAIDKAVCGDWLGDHGYSFQEISAILKRTKQSERGRRPSKRKMTIAACEVRQLYGSSWTSLAAEFCDCGRSTHDDLCSEALRKSARNLEGVLKRFRETPVPFASLSGLSAVILG